MVVVFVVIVLRILACILVGILNLFKILIAILPFCFLAIFEFFHLSSQLLLMLSVILLFLLFSRHSATLVVFSDEFSNSCTEKFTKPFHSLHLFIAKNRKWVFPNRFNRKIVSVELIESFFLDTDLPPEQILNYKLVAWVHC